MIKKIQFYFVLLLPYCCYCCRCCLAADALQFIEIFFDPFDGWFLIRTPLFFYYQSSYYNNCTMFAFFFTHTYPHSIHKNRFDWKLPLLSVFDKFQNCFLLLPFHLFIHFHFGLASFSTFSAIYFTLLTLSFVCFLFKSRIQT